MSSYRHFELLNTPRWHLPDACFVAYPVSVVRDREYQVYCRDVQLKHMPTTQDDRAYYSIAAQQSCMGCFDPETPLASLPRPAPSRTTRASQPQHEIRSRLPDRPTPPPIRALTLATHLGTPPCTPEHPVTYNQHPDRSTSDTQPLSVCHRSTHLSKHSDREDLA